MRRTFIQRRRYLYLSSSSIPPSSARWMLVAPNASMSRRNLRANIMFSFRESDCSKRKYDTLVEKVRMLNVSKGQPSRSSRIVYRASLKEGEQQLRCWFRAWAQHSRITQVGVRRLPVDLFSIAPSRRQTNSDFRGFCLLFSEDEGCARSLSMLQIIPT